MGNNQSNTRKNYRKFKIIEKSTRTELDRNWSFFGSLVEPIKTDFVDLKLEGYIDYEDGISEEISFKYLHVPKKTQKFFEQIAVGDYLTIDLDREKEKDKSYVFTFNERYYDWVLVGIEKRETDGNNIIRATNEYLGEVAEIRQQQLAAAEYSRWVVQTESWTSYNLP